MLTKPTPFFIYFHECENKPNFKFLSTAVACLALVLSISFSSMGFNGSKHEDLIIVLRTHGLTAEQYSSPSG